VPTPAVTIPNPAAKMELSSSAVRTALGIAHARHSLDFFIPLPLTIVLLPGLGCPM
jgi:hypothetical protein